MTFLREVGCVPRVCMDPAAGLSDNPWPLFHGQEAAGGRLCLCPGQPPKTCPVGGLLPHMWVQDSGGGHRTPAWTDLPDPGSREPLLKTRGC